VSICAWLWLRRGRSEARDNWGASVGPVLAVLLPLALALAPMAAASPAPDPSTAADSTLTGLQPDAFGTRDASPSRGEPARATTLAPATPAATTVPSSTPATAATRSSGSQAAAVAPVTTTATPAPAHVSVPFAPPAPTVTPLPTGKPTSDHVAPGEEKDGARLSRVLVPFHVGGISPSVVRNSFGNTDLVAADARRPVIVAPLLHGSSLVVPASLALLLLVAASGCFLLLARRIEHASRSRAS